jgi:hypothetical protein
MKKWMIAILMPLQVISLASCQNGGSPLDRGPDISEIKYSFEIDNGNCEKFGYHTVADGEDISIKGIFLDKNYIYVTDVYHNSIKKIELSTGTLVANYCIEKEVVTISGIWLRDIIVVNDTVYVTSDYGKIYILDSGLQKIIEIQKVPKGLYIFSKDASGNVQFLQNYSQNEEGSMSCQFYSISNKNSSTKNMSLTEFDTFDRNQSGIDFEYRRDKQEISVNENLYKVKSLTWEGLLKEYDGVNVSCSESHLVMFSSSAAQITFHVMNLLPTKSN